MNEFDIFNRIQFLLEFKHWTLYKLAKESGIPYSSLNNIFNRKTCPTIITLEKICNGFQISLSEFFDFENNPLRSEVLSTDQQELINMYDSLSLKDKELLHAYLKGLSKH